MPPKSCHCIFPTPTEDEMICIEGTEPGTALRVYLQAGQEGYVRLQQLAYDAGLGWYVQKSMVIPGEMLRALVPQLRKADCLIPTQNRPTGMGLAFMRLASEPSEPSPQRRQA